ncbi:MAG: DUF302 domain-containing protein [Bacteroidetes bacterium]|jgi:uncharacterized protein (DUF302 family)|nr:DUF302 domain-containing protein [Bacteroidota bacterium]MBU1580157.1 DUF302 domain-containing protein [Bacteroidota bacterium]MBU2464972.1 DUF302 domain-containing protein [Bacteroidota bacterium]MBU2557215.1 DUF302 domain-containing protein [Bacteroidota bacterium]MDA3942837.1 DUF302 domain-containing protein [Bacteroidota bacterium]
MKYAFSKTLHEDYDQLITRLEAALKTIGFGIVSTIKIDKTLKEKLDADFKRYTILGACNPHFALAALNLEEQLGVLLPCNVVVIDQGNGKVDVAAMDPAALIQQLGNEKLSQLADEIARQLKTLIERL